MNRVDARRSASSTLIRWTGGILAELAGCRRRYHDPNRNLDGVAHLVPPDSAKEYGRERPDRSEGLPEPSLAPSSTFGCVTRRSKVFTGMRVSRGRNAAPPTLSTQVPYAVHMHYGVTSDNGLAEA